MHSSSSGRRRSATSLRNPCSSGKPSVTIAPSTPIGRQAVISGFTARLRSVIVVTTEVQPRRRRSRSSPGSPGAPPRRCRGVTATAAGSAAGSAGSAARPRRSRRVGARAPARRATRARVAGARGCGCRLARRQPGAAARSRPADWRRGLARGRGGGCAVRCARDDRRRTAGGAGAEPGADGPGRVVDDRRDRDGVGGHGSSRASSSCSRRPPGPSRVGSIAASRRAAAVIPGSAGPVARLGEDPLAERVDHLVQERPQVAASLLEPVQEPDAGRGVAGGHRVAEPVDQLRVGEPQQVAHRVGLDPPRRRRQQLVQDRLGVPHPARGQPRDDLDRLGLRLATVGREDPLELAADLGAGSGAGRRTAGAATGPPAGSPAGGSTRT